MVAGVALPALPAAWTGGGTGAATAAAGASQTPEGQQLINETEQLLDEGAPMIEDGAEAGGHEVEQEKMRLQDGGPGQVKADLYRTGNGRKLPRFASLYRHCSRICRQCLPTSRRPGLALTIVSRMC